MEHIKKTLILYCYVRPTGWPELYDFHIANWKLYGNVFDREICVFSFDPETKKEYVEDAKCKVKEIFPDAEIVDWKNDKQLRESLYFYNEIIMKLDKMPDEWYFFAHFKGVDSIYMSMENVYKWVAGMYYMNLSDISEIEKGMNQPEVCCIGTYLIRNKKCWSYLKYNWHYSGTFFWFNPKRIRNVMKRCGSLYPPCDRMVSEAFLGSVIPDDERYRLPALMSYAADRHIGFSWMSEDMKQDILSKFREESKADVDVYINPENKRRVIYTCITGKYENPTDGFVKDEMYDYILFSDRPIQTKCWKNIVIESPDKDMSDVKFNRYVKTHPNEYLTDYNIAVYVDGNTTIDISLYRYIDANCKNLITFKKHSLRNCIYSEIDAVIRFKKETRDMCESIRKRYLDEGYPKNNGLFENNVIVLRLKDARVQELLDAWWDEINKYSHRDQLSLNYVIWKYKFDDIVSVGEDRNLMPKHHLNFLAARDSISNIINQHQSTPDGVIVAKFWNSK